LFRGLPVQSRFKWGSQRVSRWSQRSRRSRQSPRGHSRIGDSRGSLWAARLGCGTGSSSGGLCGSRGGLGGLGGVGGLRGYRFGDSRGSLQSSGPQVRVLQFRFSGSISESPVRALQALSTVSAVSAVSAVLDSQGVRSGGLGGFMAASVSVVLGFSWAFHVGGLVLWGLGGFSADQG
jgi:hypothetical protein